MQRRSFHPSVVSAALLLTFLSLLATPAAALPQKADSWLQLRTPHFTFFSDASERSTRQIAGNLEQLRSALAQLNPGLELASPVPTWIYIFKDTSSFRPFQPLYQGRPRPVEGFFFPHPYGNYVAINADPRNRAKNVVYHEYLHHVLENNYPGLPLWLNEGLAEYYSTFTVSGNEARVGLPVLGHVAWLFDNALLPLRDLLSMTNDSPSYNEGDRQGVFYAQSWALAHYLLSKPDRRERTARYLRDLFNGVPGDQAFEKAFGDLPTLERDLRAYVRRAVFDSQRLPVAPAAEAEMKVAPLPWPDVLYRLGEMLLNNGSTEQKAEAEKHFRAALEAEPGHGPATAGLGRIAEESGRIAEARTLYAKAAQLAPDDFFIQYLYGRSLLEPTLEPGGAPRAEAALRQSVKLRPDFAEAWGRLAQAVSYLTPLPPDAVTIFETAYRLMPARDEFAFNLALIYAQTGRTAQAQELIDKILIPRKRPDYVEKARAAMLVGEWQEIERELVQKGKLAEAVPRLEALLARMQPSERRDTLERRLDEIRGALDYNGFADRYNRAIDFLNAGKDAEAIAILEELAAKTRNPGQAEEARKLLEKVKAGPKGR